MPGDLVSLRMLVISAGLPHHELWHRAAASVTVPIELEILDVAPAAALLARAGADVFILDADLSDANKSILIKAARAAPPAPLIFMTGPKDASRPEGIDGVVARPSNADEAHNLVQLCIRAKIPTRVLVVDDSNTMRSIVRKILQASHFALRIDEASEGAAALERLRAEKFGIVFLDYNMPGLNGFETLSEIKRECPNVAVVMMTSTLDNAIADRAHAAGALAFLKKPFYPADIDATLERYYGLTVPRR
jgi:DNA-binding NarL/FixJ family response regulator